MGKYICYMQVKYVLVLNQYVLNNQGLAFWQYVNDITALFVFDLLVGNYIRILDSFCAAAKIVLDGASVHRQEWFWRRDVFDELKLPRADLEMDRE